MTADEQATGFIVLWIAVRLLEGERISILQVDKL